MAFNDEYYRATQPSSQPFNNNISSYDEPRTRPRQDTFSGRFSGVGGASTVAAQHPAALQTGSPMYLPPSTQLREDRLSKLRRDDNDNEDDNKSAFRGVDDTNTITPFDSISNIDARSDDAPPARYYGGGDDYLARDPYAHDSHGQQQQQYSKSYNTRPTSGEAYYDARDSNGSLPLMQNALQPAGRLPSNRNSRAGTPSNYYPDSIIDGDTVVDTRKKQSKAYRSLNPEEVERGIVTQDQNDGSYPPPRYDSPGSDEKGDPFAEVKADSVVSTLKGRNKSGKRPNVWLRQLRDTTPLEEKIKNHKKGVGVQDRPWACWVIAVILVVVFIVELIKSAQKTGKAISTSPFNYMIGPSSEMLINLGARFTACMRDIPEITNVPFRCLNDSSAAATSISTTCTLEDICGFGGFGTSGTPDQTFRFFTPLWLHVGVVHLLLNGLVLLTSSALVEKQMGSLRFLILYTISGVFGFVLGGNFALTGLASMGASGAIFGTHAAVLVDLIWHWKLFPRPKRMLFALIFEIIVGFGLGYIPGIDNFSHIGGFAIGLLLSIVLVPAIHQTSKHRVAIYLARTVAFVGACVMFGVLVNNFFQSDPNSACEWCRYLSCWPTDANNRCKGTGLTMTDSNSTSTSSSTPSTSTTSITPTQGTIGSVSDTNVALAIVSVMSILVTRSHYKRR